MPTSMPSPFRTSSLAVALLALLLPARTTHAAIDPIVMFDGFDGCAPVQAEIGPAGGTLRLCGAVLTVPPDAVESPVLFGIAPVDEPDAAPFDMELAGPAFRFTPDDVYFPIAPSIRVPREDARRGGIAMHDPTEQEFFMIEACEVSRGGVQQYSGILGTFAAVRYIGDLPVSTQGLGDGTLEATIAGTTHLHDLDTPGANWAIYNDLPDGRKLITVSTLKDVPNGIEAVRLDFTIDPQAGTGDLAQISALGSVSGSFIAGIMGEATLVLGDISDGRIRGTIDATLASGADTVAFDAQFDIAAERYYFPPSLSCPGGGDFPPG